MLASYCIAHGHILLGRAADFAVMAALRGLQVAPHERGSSIDPYRHLQTRARYNAWAMQALLASEQKPKFMKETLQLVLVGFCIWPFYFTFHYYAFGDEKELEK